MADNVSQAGANTVATDDIGGVHYQRVKVTWGADGVANDASSATPLPVVQASAIPTGTNEIGAVKEMRASTLTVTNTAAAGSAVTVTLPAAGAGLFHYVTHINLSLYSSAARTGAAAPWLVTTTNLPGTPAWTFSTAGAIGTNESQTFAPTTPLKSTAANTASTVVGAAATGGIWRITVTYFTAA